MQCNVFSIHAIENNNFNLAHVKMGKFDSLHGVRKRSTLKQNLAYQIQFLGKDLLKLRKLLGN